MGVLPTLLSMLLIVPSTLYRTVFVFTQKPKQTMKDKLTLVIGLLITLLYSGAIIKLAFT
ncbi:hypothetical protein PNIG_a1815 [Pseudoalteromonas nigrifaciens]|uniref:Uncharacterized protein n=2 Tax=Pseudoalteromonas nigrifaciens TaxID=28109 RepID=A0AAC9XXR9_9GAMM|nr:hypothetical protein PNIG_a1815 [Pseudoalteromonas nigrifaciens]